MRKQIGMNLVPANVGGLRRAERHLEQGGAVLTSVDFPAQRTRLHPRFFGRPSALPNISWPSFLNAGSRR